MFHCFSAYGADVHLSPASSPAPLPPSPLPPAPLPPAVAELSDAAAELARLADSLTGAFDEVVAHHRPDVWQGAIATAFGSELDEHRRRLLHPTIGAVTAIADAAVAARVRADALASSACPAPPVPLWMVPVVAPPAC